LGINILDYFLLSVNSIKAFAKTDLRTCFGRMPARKLSAVNLSELSATSVLRLPQAKAAVPIQLTLKTIKANSQRYFKRSQKKKMKISEVDYLQQIFLSVKEY
jgi:hypothetical protein